MSALAVTDSPVIEQSQALYAVPVRHNRLGKVPFIFLMLAVSISGLGGVVALSNTVSAQSQQLVQLAVQADELRYEEAALSAKVQQIRSSAALATRARELGMVPNDNPVFMQVTNPMNQTGISNSKK